jgi:curved DNA-binding protein CbpA
MTDSLDFIYDNENFVDLYKILEIDMDATSETIKTTYITLAKIHHPDQGGNSEMFQKITKAYEILSNKNKRKDYDLYYLKKSFEEFNDDGMQSLKEEYNNFVNTTYKPVSKEKLDEIYNNLFCNDVVKETPIDKNLTIKRLNDLKFERENIDIETNDQQLFNIVNENSDINVTELYEYLKNKSNNNESEQKIINKEIGTLDTLPNYGNNYSFIDNEIINSDIYSDVMTENSFISKEVLTKTNLDDFKNWKQSKKSDNKLSPNDIEKYLEQRKHEEQGIYDSITNSIRTNTKKKEITQFLKTTKDVLDESLSENLKDQTSLENSSSNNQIKNIRKREIVKD